MGIITIIFYLTIPYFYILGLIHFFTCLKKPVVSSIIPQSTPPSVPTLSPPPVPNQSKSSWYSIDSINFLLYLGAFLVVTAGVYFIKFQWSSFSGVTKSGIFTVFALCFLLLGLILAKLPKIRLAGITFISIGAVLLPLSGIAWYSFYFKQLGTSLGLVWLVTSLLTIGLYLYLLSQFQHQICSYALNIAAFSSVLALVNIREYDSIIYVLISLIFAITMLFISHYLASLNEILLSTPISITSQIVVPVVLIYSLANFNFNHNFNTLETSYSFILAAIFYGLNYFFSSQLWQFNLVLAFLPLATASYFGSQNLSPALQTIYVALIGIDYAIFSNFLADTHLVLKKNLFIFGFIIAFLMLLLSSATHPTSIQTFWLIFIPAIVALINYLSLRHHLLLVLASIFIAFALNYNFIIIAFLSATNITLIFALIAIIIFIIGEFLPVNYSLSTVVFALFSLTNVSSDNYLRIALIFIFSLMLIRISHRLQKISYTYYGLALSFLGINIIAFRLFPFIYAYSYAHIFYSVLLYIISFIVPTYYRQALRYSALSISLLAFFQLSQKYSAYDYYALVTLYLSTLLFVIEAYLTSNLKTAYFASVLVMFTYIRQIGYLHINDTLSYSLPIGLYLMALAHHRRYLQDFKYSVTLDRLGIFALFWPTFILSFGSDTVSYSLWLGGLGILMSLFGISISIKSIRNAGFLGIVLSILPQTYQYVLHLPRFVLIGSFGLVFLVVAIYLLWKRSDK